MNYYEKHRLTLGKALRCRRRNSNHQVNGLCGILGKPRFRHYLFIPALGFLGRHWRQMLDSLSVFSRVFRLYCPLIIFYLR